MINTSESAPRQDAPSMAGAGQHLGVSAWIRAAAIPFVFAAVLFVPAGRWGLPMFWAYWVVFCLFGAITLIVVNRKHPDLLQERFRPGPGARDPRTRPLLVPIIVGHWIVAGLDVGRYHWSDGIPLAAQLAALLVFALGLSGWGWAMYSNRFFSSEVRIQTDRGHCVQSGGPYRYVRHPGYASALLVFLASPIVLGSLWALLPSLVTVLVFARRTALEDRMLLAELPGYAHYAEQVRFRLLYGVW